jgi:hypothetical protein
MEEEALEAVHVAEVDMVVVKEDAAVVAKVEEKEDVHQEVEDSAAVEEATVVAEKEDAVAVVKVAKDAEEAVINQNI